jgi:hypothetical protein
MGKKFTIKNLMYMRNFLNRLTRNPGHYTRSAVLFISLLFTGFNRIYAFSGPVHGGNVINGYAKCTDTVKPSSAILPANFSNDEFRKKALAKLREFEGCLFILCDNTASETAQDNAVDRATSLFIEGSIIEVSSVRSNEKKHLKVRDFLEKFRNLRYDRVVITFSHVDYVTNIRKGIDGKYYGLVSYEQTFRGYNDGRLVYEDETKKTTEVQLVVYERSLRGNAIQQWDVMLSDVEIVGTKRPKS